MNSRAKRLLILAAALLGALLLFSWILKRGSGSGDPTPSDGGSKKSLTALRKTGKSGEPGSSPALGTTEPVEANALNLLGGRTMLPVTPEQVESALDAGGRSIDGLIAAQAILGDHRYLREAAERYPDDPRTQFWMVAERVLPEERAEWLERFKEVDPDNAMANFLAAEHAFRSDDIEAGVAELRAAGAKGYRDYSDDLRGEVAALYSATNQFDPASVQDASAGVSSMPHVEQVQSLTQRLIEYQRELREEGEDEMASEVVELGTAMLETVAGNSALDAIGARTMMLFMQENLQRAAGDPNQTLTALSAERERVAGLGESLRSIFAREGLLDASQLAGYSERLHDQGEVAAAEWLVGEVGELPPTDPE